MQDKIELDLNEIFKIMKKKKIAIIGTTIVVAIITAIVNLYVLKPVYESKASIIVGPENIMENIAYAYSSDTVTLSQKLLKTYTQIATSDTVLSKTIDDLSLNYSEAEYDSFKNRVFITYEENTQLLEVAVQDNDPVIASKIANKLTENFMIEAEKFLPQGDMKLLDKASVVKNEIKPNKALNVIVATTLTFIGITTIIVLKELKQIKIVDEIDVEKYLDLRVVGTIRQMKSN